MNEGQMLDKAARERRARFSCSPRDPCSYDNTCENHKILADLEGTLSACRAKLDSYSELLKELCKEWNEECDCEARGVPAHFGHGDDCKFASIAAAKRAIQSELAACRAELEHLKLLMRAKDLGLTHQYEKRIAAESRLASRESSERQKVSKDSPICEHGRNAWADDCGMCELAGTDYAMVPPERESSDVRAALIDLVRLKDLKQWIEAGLLGADEETKINARAQYEREKEPALEAARLALEAAPSLAERGSPKLNINDGEFGMPIEHRVPSPAPDSQTEGLEEAMTDTKPRSETPRAKAIVAAYLEKCDTIYSDGSSAADIERDLEIPIGGLESELAACRAELERYKNPRVHDVKEFYKDESRLASREGSIKWCSYCGVDTHNDAECWCTRPADWSRERYPDAFKFPPALQIRRSFTVKGYSFPLEMMIDRLQHLAGHPTAGYEVEGNNSQAWRIAMREAVEVLKSSPVWSIEELKRINFGLAADRDAAKELLVECSAFSRFPAPEYVDELQERIKAFLTGQKPPNAPPGEGREPQASVPLDREG
jgi:hypothetical protein